MSAQTKWATTMFQPRKQVSRPSAVTVARDIAADDVQILTDIIVY